MQKAIDILNRTIKNSFDHIEIKECAIAVKFLENRLKYKGFFKHEFLEVVCSHYNVELDDLKVRTRKPEILLPRQIIMWYFRSHSDYSLSEIGNIFDKDHTSVLHSKKVINNRIDTEKIFRNELQLMLNEVELSIDKVRR